MLPSASLSLRTFHSPTYTNARTCEHTQGHGNLVQIHPSSFLFGEETLLDWVLYHEVLITSKTYLRTVCPIQHEWVEALLPRLHEVCSLRAGLSGSMARCRADRVCGPLPQRFGVDSMG